MSRSGCADEAEMIGHFRYSLKSQSFFIPQHCSMLNSDRADGVCSFSLKATVTLAPSAKFISTHTL